MSLFRRATPTPPARQEQRSTVNLTGLASYMTDWSTNSGAPVTLDGAMRNAAAWACVNRLKATITALPIDVIRVSGDRRTALPKAQHPDLIRSPAVTVSRRGWVGQVIHGLTTSGNAYGDVLATDSLGRPTMIETINSGRVSNIGGQLHVDGKPRVKWPLGDLWHISASHLLVDGAAQGMSPVSYARESIGAGLQAEKFGADFFRNGGTPVSILRSSLPDLTLEQANAAKDALRRASKNRDFAVLGEGWDLSPFNIDPKDTQFIELLEFSVLQACRFWMVPPSMVYAAISGQNVTYANVTDADLSYLKHSVANWVVDLEDSWADMIAGPLVAKFNVDAVLRMDKKGRTQEHAMRLQTKTRTVNEVRRLEDEEPFPDPIYDQPGIPGDQPNIVGVADVASPAA